MKAVEFSAVMNSDGTLTVPPSAAKNLKTGEPLRVLILLTDADADLGWGESAAHEFGMGYADGDAIYDRLSAR